MLREFGFFGYSVRVVIVFFVIYYVVELNMDDFQSSVCYLVYVVYVQSKLVFVLFIYYFQWFLVVEGSYVIVNVVDFGVVNMDFYQYVFWGICLVMKFFSWLFFKIFDEGVWIFIYVVVILELEGVGGCYLYNEKEIKFFYVIYNQKLQQQFWFKSCDMIGVFDVIL